MHIFFSWAKVMMDERMLLGDIWLCIVKDKASDEINRFLYQMFFKL